MDNRADSSEQELSKLVEAAKHYADIAKDIADFDPDAYYTKEETVKKIQDAISAITDYDEQSF